MLLIDAVLGLGMQRSTRTLSSALAIGLDTLRRHTGLTLAVDLPSGLNADTGEGEPWTLRAHATLSLLTLKPGLFTGEGRDFAGNVWRDDLGVNSPSQPDAWLSSDAPAHVPRCHVQHKGSFGDVTVVGGAPGMTGAALLAADAAQAAGAGRVHVGLLSGGPTSHESPLPLSLEGHVVNPAPMVHTWNPGSVPATGPGETVVCGCGGGQAMADTLPSVMATAARLVIDADGLNALAAHAPLRRQLKRRAALGRPTILTPHPLEAARLLGATVAEVQSDRLRAAQQLAAMGDCVVVLKGSGSIIAAPNCTPLINLPGNAALANAGTGDVLAGWLAGWWAQAGTTPGDCFQSEAQALAGQAVAWHGAAAEPLHPGALRPTDLIERMHERLRRG